LQTPNVTMLFFSGRFSKGVAEFEIEHPYFKVYKKQYAKRVV